MRLRVSPEALALGLHHPRVWRLSGEMPLLHGNGLTDKQVALAYDASSPLPDGYRKLLAALGHDVIPAGERLRELLRTRGWKSHGAVIDAVSVATLKHGAGIGLHRLAASDEGKDLVITRATGGERITPAFSTRSRPIPSGDLIYGIPGPNGAFDPFAWLGRRDCDSADRQLTSADHEALLVVLGCPGEDTTHTQAIGATVADVLGSIRPDVSLTPFQCTDG
jgi:DNA/RNA-binding domain of Phe-tRNA-synthetase-like protein